MQMQGNFQPWPTPEEYQQQGLNVLAGQHNLKLAKQAYEDEMARRQALVERQNTLGQQRPMGMPGQGMGAPQPTGINALGPNPQQVKSYQDYQAQQEIKANQQKDAVLINNLLGPVLDNAFENGEDGVRQQFIERYDGDDNPLMQSYVDLMKQITFTGPRTAEFVLDTTVDEDEYKKAGKLPPAQVYASMFGQEAPPNWKGTVKYRSMPDGTRVAYEHKEGKPEKVTKGKLAKGDAFPNTAEGIAMAKKKLGISPAEEEQAKLYLKDHNMLSVEYSVNEDGTFSLKPMEKAPRPAGTTVHFGEGGGSVDEQARAIIEWRQPAPSPGSRSPQAQKVMARVYQIDPKYDQGAAEAFFREQKASAGQAGGAKSAALYRADGLFKKSAPRLIALRNKLSKDDQNRLIKLSTGAKAWNDISMGLEQKFRDNPILAEYIKTTVLLADALSTVYGAGPGGEWSFNMAKQMLDPTVGPKSYKTTLGAHGEKIKSSLKYAKSFRGSADIPGRVQGLRESGSGAGRAGESGKPSYEQWLPAAMKANPKATKAELKKYYDEKYGSK